MWDICFFILQLWITDVRIAYIENKEENILKYVTIDLLLYHVI